MKTTYRVIGTINGVRRALREKPYASYKLAVAAAVMVAKKHGELDIVADEGLIERRLLTIRRGNFGLGSFDAAKTAQCRPGFGGGGAVIGGP